MSEPANTRQHMLIAPGTQEPSPGGSAVASGSDAYDTSGNTTRAWKHPDPDGERTYSTLICQLGDGASANISLDGGQSDAVVGMSPNSTLSLPGVSISGDIHVRNTSAGNDHGEFQVLAVI